MARSPVHRIAKREDSRRLTEREYEILRLLVIGLNDREIAARLSVDEKTVRRYISLLFSKLGVSNRLELIIHAYYTGLVTPCYLSREELRETESRR